MFNKGLHQHRFKENPLEKRFAKKWDEMNPRNRNNNFDYLMAVDNNRPSGEVSNRDREVAATVIQWLGSHVGQCFLEDVLEIPVRELIKKDWAR